MATMVPTDESNEKEHALAPSEDAGSRARARPGTLRSGLAGSRRVVVAVAVVVIAAVMYFLMAGQSQPMPDRVAETRVLTEAEFVAETGTELLYIGQTAGGGLLDIRYRVIDPERALVFHDESLPVGLYQPGGVYLDRPFHEHSHDVELHRAVVYNELIVNLGSTFDRGDTVTLVVGPYRLENVQIQ